MTGQDGHPSGSRTQNNSPKRKSILNYKIKLKNNHAEYNISQCLSDTANLLIDTGAELNLIKLSSLKDDVLVSDDKIYKMQGINKLVNTRGSTMLTVFIDNKGYNTEF